jgi:ABC-type branched-subunit amino acid transport system substrate-binding protein
LLRREASFTIGLLLGVSNFFDSWKLAAELAIADMEASNLIPGYRLLTVTESTAVDAASSLVAAINLANRGVVGILGASRSSFAIAVQYYLSALSLPHFSPSATADSLSDKSLYSSFLRTVPSDRYQGIALASLVDYFGWKCAVIAHFQEEYASNSKFSFFFQKIIFTVFKSISLKI